MINNQSNKPEHLQPQDAERKHIKHPEDDEEAVVKSKDLQYKKKEATFHPEPAEQKEKSEQPIQVIKDAPKDI